MEQEPAGASFGALFDAAVAAAREWRSRTGGKVIGYLGADVPVELIEAAGLLPVRLGVFQPGLEQVREYQEMGDSDWVALMANAVLEGRFDFADHIVIGNSPIANITLFHFLRESRRLDPAFRSPSVIFHEMHHSDGATIDQYNLESCRRLAKRLGEIGTPMTDETLRAAIARTNARRDELARLAEQRRDGTVTGTDAFAQLVRWQTNPQAQLIELKPVPRALPRVLFSGSDVGHFAHYALVESAGCTIVADDHDWGYNVVATPVGDGDPMTAIATRYTRQTPRVARWPRQMRIDSVVERAAAAKVDAVVFWIIDEDQSSSWDVPELRDALRGRAIASIDLGVQPLLNYDAAAITAQLRKELPK